MFSSDATYTFRLSKAGLLTNGSSVINVNIATDLTVFSEGAALAALFDEVKLVKTRFEIHPSAHLTQFAYVIGYEPVVSTVTPSASALLRLPCSQMSATFVTVRPQAVLEYVAPRSSIYGLVTDEGVATPRVRSGLNGTFSFSWVPGQTNAPTTGETVAAYALMTIAHFRKRG